MLRRMLDTIRPLHFDEREALRWAFARAVEDERARRSEEDTAEHEVPRGE